MSQSIFQITLPTPFAVGDVNIYLIKGDKLTLVDVGPKTKEALDSLKSQLRELGYSLDDIEQVIITHHHPDHVGLLDYFNKNKISILGFRYNEPWLLQDKDFLEYHHQFYQKLYNWVGASEFYLQEMQAIERYLQFGCHAQINHFLREGDKVAGLPGWTVIETPGHAQGHISIFHEEDGILVAGDHLIQHISSNAIIEPPGIGDFERPKSLLLYRESMKKCLDYQIKLVLPGHGKSFENAHELILERFHKHEERAEKIRQFIIDAPLTAFEICKKLFPMVYKKELGLTLSETIGHLDLLIELEKVKMEETEGLQRFVAE
jgi:glyoxylase-like metal-dependent hydrolase (beta-lactamase superfamily II)